VGDGWLTPGERLLEVTGTQLPVGPDDRKQTEPHRVGQRAQKLSDLACLTTSQMARAAPPGPTSPAVQRVRTRDRLLPLSTCSYMCYTRPVDSSISVRDLRNTVSEVLRRVEGGERLTVTVDRRPVAEIVPLRRHRTVPAADALEIASRHAADRDFLKDVRGLLADTTDDL
jgi:prevent-host-death family protein